MKIRFVLLILKIRILIKEKNDFFGYAPETTYYSLNLFTLWI